MASEPVRLSHLPFEVYDPSKLSKYEHLSWHPGAVPIDSGAKKSNGDYLVTTLPSERQSGSAWTHCFLLRPLKAFIMNTPGFPTAPVNPSIASHRIRASPFGGMGMFATRFISQGDLILSERALIIAPAAMPCTYNTDGLSADDEKRVILHSAEKHLQNLAERMDADEKNAYMSLYNDHKLDGSGPLLGILRTNGYGIDKLREEGTEGNAGAYSGVFAQMSRINHSCAPNTTRLFHMPSFSMRLYATRDISPGEEMTASYDSVWKSTALRQKQLAPYGFRCSCPCCSNAKVSDRRRARIEDSYGPNSLRKRFALLPQMKRSPETSNALLRDIEEGLRLFTEEGLEGSTYYPTFLVYVCAVLNALGTDGVRFRKYGIALLKSWIALGLNLGELVTLFQTRVVPLYRLHYISSK